VGDGVRAEDAGVGLARYCGPPPDNGLGARADEPRAGISRAGGIGLDPDPDPEPEADADPEDTLEGPANDRPLLLALELETGSERPRGEEFARGDRAIGLGEGIDS
jgi:hypothetical protein